MQNGQFIPLKLLIMISVLAAIGLVLVVSGVRPLIVFSSVAGVALLLWRLIRRKQPELETPCASVSCCHYLGDIDGGGKG